MRFKQILFLLLPGIFILNGCEPDNSITVAINNFADPALHFKSRPLWFWNTALSKAQTTKILKEAKACGYYGLGIVPSYGMKPDYMSPEFLNQYKYALEAADSLGMKMCFYDEFYFPSGMAGGNLVKQYPEAVSKRLDKEEVIFMGPGTLNHPIPSGIFIGAVAMEMNTLERIDLSDKTNGKVLIANLDEGKWRIMIFVLSPDQSSGRNHVDYLEPLAVERFIELTYDKYYEAFPSHFGTTIDFAFYDEPCLRWVEEGRTWTGAFNEKFEKQYGFNPITYYPSMWYDIGHETSAARNMLFGFRAELFASGFAGTLNQWCYNHNIQLTGHVDQEEVLNPVSICGDLIKSFKYQDIPCVDQIAHYQRASKIYKLISAAAINYNRPLVASETYGAMRNLPVENLYKEAMDQFAKGINLMEPHAVWYSDKADIPPNLSPSNPNYGPHLNEYNKYIGRLQMLLQGGQHVADIALLYPIASLQASYTFAPGDPGLGGKTSAEADYLDIGEILSQSIRADYTFLHPETLDNECIEKEGLLNFENQSESSNYQMIILPGSRTINWSNLKKIKTFYDNGGMVIATSVLPNISAEMGHDEDVRRAVKEMFGEDAVQMKGLARVTASSIWNTGGFLPGYAIDKSPETSWRPSSGNPKGEWLSIEFDKKIVTGHIALTGEESLEHTFWKGWAPIEEDQSFSFTLLVKIGHEWKEAGNWDKAGKDKSVFFKKQSITGIKVLIQSGKNDKVSIPEISIFDEQDQPIDILHEGYLSHQNDNGGIAYFIQSPNPDILEKVIDQAPTIRDVTIGRTTRLANGNLTYIHKKMDNRDIYFFANSSDQELEVPVQLRGKLRLTIWDPHTGTMEKYPAQTSNNPGGSITSFNLKLGRVKSVFMIGE